MPMDPVTDARDLVVARFPDAVWALLTGSVTGPHRTAGSDLDIMVLREAGPSFRESLRFRGWPVELFVNTRASLERFLTQDIAIRKPSTHRMVAQGVPLVGDPAELQARCARVLADGPPPLTKAEQDSFRYGLTDLLDDHKHAIDAGERVVIAAALWTAVAQAELTFAGRWISRGKWLLRELRELDPDFATRWLAARDDPTQLAGEVLAARGGPLFEGYRAIARTPRRRHSPRSA
jgi:hypothetical protein